MRSVSSQISLRQRAVVVARRLLEQLRRAANAGQRILDLMRQHGGKRDHRARRAAMRQLPVHLVGDGALLQHDHDVIRIFRHRPDVEIDQPLARIARRGEVDLVFVHRASRVRRTCSTSVSSGEPNGTRSRNMCRRSIGIEASKNCSAATLASAILPSADTMITGCGKALMHGVGRRRCRGGNGLRPAHAAALQAKAS